MFNTDFECIINKMMMNQFVSNEILKQHSTGFNTAKNITQQSIDQRDHLNHSSIMAQQRSKEYVNQTINQHPNSHAVMQARARSVNAQALGSSGQKQANLRTKLNKSSVQNEMARTQAAYFSQQKNRASTSQGQRFNFAQGPPHIDPRMNAFQMEEGNFPIGVSSFTPSALQQAQATRQYAQMLMTSNQSNNPNNAYLGGAGGGPLHIETFLHGSGLGNNFHMNNAGNRANLSTTTTPLNNQRRVVRHNKAFSMNQTGRVAPVIYTGGAIPVYAQQTSQFAVNGRQQSNSKIVVTEQFLNQPLQTLNNSQHLNNRLANHTIQYGQGSLQQLNPQHMMLGSTPLGAPALYTPLNYQTIPMAETSLGGYPTQMQQQAVLSGRLGNQTSPKSIQNSSHQTIEGSLQGGQQQQPLNMYLYNPFTNYKRQQHGNNGGVPSMSSQSSSRISTQKMQKQMNSTIQHIRSFSTYSQPKVNRRSGIVNSNTTGVNRNQAPNNNTSGSVLNANQTNNNMMNEAQMIESEEYFEQGKVFLSDKKYKEAIKAFQKSVQMNKMNYDALFYKGVSQLDNGQPDKAIIDLNELIEMCPDYRKTVFIVLSIAYRRVNDYTGALRTLSKAIVKYPRYIEAFIARGQIFIFQKKWDKALSDFRAVIQVSPDNGLGYLGQGDSLKGIGNYNGALQSYSKAIEIDTTCVQQGLMKRGILYLQMKYNDKALEDFNKLCELAEQESAETQTKANSNTLSNIQNYTGTPQGNTALSKSYFYKAKALKKLNNCNDAILYFEQVIRMCDDQFLQSSALYEIAKIKIQQKDFYEAYYNLQRATHYKLKQKKLINYKIFTEGVIFLMKRKTKTGLKLLSSLIDKITQSSQVTQQDYITPLVYLYRAYGHFITDDYDKALKDYIRSNQMKKLNTSASYNMIMCQGLKSLEKKEYENAISFFTKAGQKLPGNRDPYFLRAVSVVQYALHKPIKPQTKNKMLRDAKRDLNRALKHSPKDYQVMYFRGTLNFALHYFYDAITDFETVIEKSEETNAKYYLARGRCYACLSMFKEAITDLSIAINLNKDLLDAYLNRGKCAYLIGDTGLAFMDFQKLIVLEPKNPMVHIYAGNLLMTTGSYEDATKAFTNADNIHKSPLALYQRSRCQVALNNMQEALKDLNKVIEASPNDKVAIADKECLTALKLASVGAAGAATQATGSQMIVQAPLDKSFYEKAIVILTKLIQYEKNEHLAKINHDSSVLYQHSQIIPSAQRTQADKIKAIRRRREQDRQMKQLGDNNQPRKNDLRFRVQHQADPNGNPNDEEADDYDDVSDLMDERELEKLNRELAQTSNDILIDETESEMLPQGGDKRAAVDQHEEQEEEGANYYKENIFNKEDYYLYRAAMYFYAGDFDKAINDFEMSSSIMHSQKVLYPRNQFPDEPSQDEGGRRDNDDDAVTINSSQTDLSDVGLCSLNIHEYSFNTVLCLLQMKDYKKAVTKLDYIFDTIPKKYAGQLWLIRGLANQQVNGHQHLAKRDFKKAYKYDKENATRFLDQKQSVQLPIFPQSQRLCNSMAFVKVLFPGYTAGVYLKPSFSFPFIKPPNMIPCVDNSVLEQFTAKAIPLKPEAPWIKRCSFGIKFTDEIYFTDDDREATPDEEKEYKKRKQQQQQRAARAAAAFTRSLSERVVLRTNIFVEQPPPTAVGGARRGKISPEKNNHQMMDEIEDHAMMQDEDEDDIDLQKELLLFPPSVFNKPQMKLSTRPKIQQQVNPPSRAMKKMQDEDDEDFEQVSDDDFDDSGAAAAFIMKHSRQHPNGEQNQIASSDDEDDDIDEEAFKEALEKAKIAAEKLSERPRSKKQ